ncbi:TonB-dependent siderophore receptor [Maricaulis sp.]|uniref:TonB-dependent receptor plug domain-containing protein n=1 Tax=unclassified Maricaulis TaxID=2632371 RepID=UPI001B182FAE|nr:TonB-dependent receptor [Maricaulis sp.]MBO6796485.1 TonB-dependent receptor [Maricaulis sp.]
MRLFSSLLASTALFSLSAPAFAQDDVILVTAARVPVLAQDSTTSVTQLDSADLEARGPLFVADILRAVPSLAVSRSGPVGQLTQIRARGSEANHVLVLIDGVEAASPFTGEADFANFLFDDLGSIEVARGEQSALWGADAIGGVIALTTRRPDDGRSWNLSTELGSFGTARANAGVRYGGDGLRLRAGLGHYRTDGIDVSGLDGETEGYINTNGYFGGEYDLAADWTLDASVRWISYETDSDADTDYDGRLENTENERHGEQLFGRLGLAGEQELDGYKLDHRLTYQFTSDEAESLLAGARTGVSEGSRRELSYQATALWSAGSFSNRLTGLLEHQVDETENFAGPGNGANQSRELETTAFAFDYGLSVAAFDLSLSARHEQNDRFEDATTWRVGTAFELQHLDARIRASIGEAVKNPGVFELFGFFPAFFVGNPSLQPETSQGWEIGWEQQLLDGQARWSAVWFSSELENEIYTDFGVFPATALNADGTSTREGLELEGEYQVSDAVSVFASASFLSSEDPAGAEIRRPEELASVTFSWAPAASDWSASASLDYTGEQGDTDFGTFTPVTLDAYTLVSGQISRRIGENFSLYVRGENLLDEEYQDVFGYHTRGRGAFIGVRFNHG